MKLSTKMRYGTRVMVSLATAYPTRAVSVKELSQEQNLSGKYLEQIMAALKAAGMVNVVRGVHGGYTLAREPSSIRLIELFRTLEGSLAIVDCVEDPSTCQMSEDCVTREIWSEMRGSLEKILKKTTLKALVERKAQKKSSLAPMYHI